MGCCGDSFDINDFKEIQDPTVVKARGTLLNTALANLGKNATPFPKNVPVAAGTNALRRNSSNLLNAMMTGKPYTSASPGKYGDLVDPSAVGTYKIGGSPEDGTDPSAGKFKCKKCPATFDTALELREHMKQEHGWTKDEERQETGGYFDPYDSSSWM